MSLQAPDIKELRFAVFEAVGQLEKNTPGARKELESARARLSEVFQFQPLTKGASREPVPEWIYQTLTMIEECIEAIDDGREDEARTSASAALNKIVQVLSRQI